jgi:hypothetical protein
MERKRALASLGVALALLACTGKDDSGTRQASVEGAYQEFADDFAACGQALEECAVAADGDAASLDQCALDYRSCRDSAGTDMMGNMAGAIAACAEQATECRRSAEGDAQQEASCRDQLWACLGDDGQDSADDAGTGDDDAGTAGTESDAGTDGSENDAGIVTDDGDGDEGDGVDGDGDDGDGDGTVDEHGHGHHHHGATGGDCIDKLKRSVEKGKDAHSCAREIRQCVADAQPDPDDVSSEPSPEPSPVPSSESSDESEHSASHHESAASRWASARACGGEYRRCLWQKHGPRACIQALHECTH